MAIVMFLAGSFEEAQAAAAEAKLKPCRWKYVENPGQLSRLLNPTVVEVGTFSSRPDAAEIMGVVRGLGLAVNDLRGNFGRETS